MSEWLVKGVVGVNGVSKNVVMKAKGNAGGGGGCKYVCSM